MAISVRTAAVFLVVCLLLLHSQRPTSAARRHHRKQGIRNRRRDCPDDMFDDRQRAADAEDGTPNCRPCSECLKGYGATRLCTRYNDTVCSPCPEGYYSPSTSMWGGCIPCKRCGRRQLVGHACDATSNTVCSHECEDGYFYSALDSDCLPCSPCHNHLKYGDTSVRVPACAKAGMDPDMQCWPLPAATSESWWDYGIVYASDASNLDDYSSDFDSPSTPILFDHRVPTTTTSRSPTSRHPESNDDHLAVNLDDRTARIYTFVLLTLLSVVGFCVLLSIIILLCLCRLLRMTGRPSSRNKKGYQCISKKTAELLVKQPTHV